VTAPARLTPARTPPLGWTAIGAILALAYFVVLGGTMVGELDPFLRLLNALIAGWLLVRYLWRMPKAGDRIDVGLLAAVVLFAIAGTASHAPRQSFDAVLEAATYAAALFTARDLLAREAVRTAFVRVLMGFSLFLTVLIASLWFPLVIGWWSATDQTVLPPLDLTLFALPWGHRYPLVLLLALLYPAWWVGAASRLRRVLRVGVGILLALVVLIIGSRTLWGALIIAGVLGTAPAFARTWLRQSPRVRTLLLASVLACLALLLVSGFAATLAQRASSSATLGLRTAMLGPTVAAWSAHPIAGYGPGSFPWLLQTTNYFDANTYAPQQPDSVPIQVLGEAGLLGILSIGLILATLLPRVLHGRSAATRFVLFAFAFVSLAATPTDFPYLMAIILGWVAFAVPHEPTGPRPLSGGSTPVRIASVGAFGVVAVAYLATLGASFSYEQARSAVAEGDLVAARQALDVAASLDPSLGLYQRQRGVLAYLQAQPKSAVSDLLEATRLNPSDDLAWRMLVLASDAAGDDAGSHSALTKALAVQRSDVTNLLVSVWWLGRHEGVPEAREILAEVVQSWPAIVAAPGWADILPPSVTTRQIVDEATRRWELGLRTPAPPRDQGLWLAALDDRPDLDERAIRRATLSRRTAEAELVLLRCGSAENLLNEATDEEKRVDDYWIARLRASALAHRSDEAALAAFHIMSGDLNFPDDGHDTLNPLNENGTDVGGYRRLPIQWPEAGLRLPSPRSGSSIWLLDPFAAVRNAGLADTLPACR
jgi:O-antigen ligase